METDSWSTQGSGWTRSKCPVCDVFPRSMVSSSSVFFRLRSGLLDPGALVSIGVTRIVNFAVLSQVAAIRGSPSRVAEWVETIPVALPRAWLLQGRRPTENIAVRASGCHVRTVTVVHLINNHVADSYSSMVQAASRGLVRREHHGARRPTSQHRLSDNTAGLTCGCKINRHACQV